MTNSTTSDLSAKQQRVGTRSNLDHAATAAQLDSTSSDLQRRMIDLDEITPLILTYNEAPNLRATLAALRWARQIIVIDSGSEDQTREIAESFANVTVIHRDFDNHTDQWNFGLDQVKTEWTLTLDADYVCPPELIREIESLDVQYDVYQTSFVYHVFGRPLRRTLYPPRSVLFRAASFRCRADGHTQRLDDRGVEVGKLKTPLIHDDRKPIGAWLRAQTKYAFLEADKIDAAAQGTLSWKDRLRRRIVLAPPIILVYCLVYRLLILDGWRGIYYSIQRFYAELILSLVLLDRKVREK